MVTQRDITAVIDAMERKGLAPLTIKTHWGVIKAFFGWLAEEDVLTVSPIAKASVSADAVLDRVREIVVPDFRYIDMLSTRLGTTQDRLVFELLLGTGGRRSEVAGMVVGDVDLAAKRIWIRQPVVEVEGRLVRNPTPKGGRNRAVVVGPQLAKLPREHLMRMDTPRSDTPLLVSVDGKLFRWKNYLERQLRPMICSTAVRWAVGERKRLIADGLSRGEATAQAVASAQTLKKLTPHHLRHTAAALLWAAGASDIEVQLILGHSDLATSKRLYAHLLEGSQDSAAARVEQLREARRASSSPSVAQSPESWWGDRHQVGEGGARLLVMSIGEEFLEERRRRRRTGDRRLSPQGREILLRLASGDLQDEFQAALDEVSATDPLIGGRGLDINDSDVPG